MVKNKQEPVQFRLNIIPRHLNNEFLKMFENPVPPRPFQVLVHNFAQKLTFLIILYLLLITTSFFLKLNSFLDYIRCLHDITKLCNTVIVKFGQNLTLIQPFFLPFLHFIWGNQRVCFQNSDIIAMYLWYKGVYAFSRYFREVLHFTGIRCEGKKVKKYQ